MRIFSIRQLFNACLVALCLLSDTLSDQIISQTQTWLPKLVWTIWDNKIPDDWHSLKVFQANRQLMTQGWQVIHLDNTNTQFWLQKIPDYQNLLNQQYFRNAQLQKKSDLIRLLILKYFGGVYIDYTVIFTEPLDWVLKLKESEFVVNKFGSSPQVLLMHNSFHGSKQTIKDALTKKEILIKPTYENFFIAAKPGAKFISQWLDIFVEMRKQSYKKYGNLTQQTQAYNVAQKQGISIGKFKKAYFEQSMCAQIVLQRKQKQMDKEWKIKNKQYREFAVQYYNIWTIDAGKTAYGIHQSVQFNEYKFVQRFTQISMATLDKLKAGPKYFVKLYSGNRFVLERFLLNDESIKNTLCPNNNFIVEDSYFYHYLVKDYPTKFFSNEVVKRAEQNACWSGNKFQYEGEIIKLNNKLQELKKKQEKQKETAHQLRKQIKTMEVKRSHRQFIQRWAIFGIISLNIIIIYYGIKIKKTEKINKISHSNIYYMGENSWD